MSILIVYYSLSGNTKKLAESIKEKVGGVLHEVQPQTPYPSEYNAVTEQAKQEIKNKFCPALKSKVNDMESYDTIFVGSPNWWNTIAPPLSTFLREHNLSGKKILPFCTHGGGGVGNIEKDISKLCPKSEMKLGLSVYGSKINDAQIEQWIKNITD
jgi:flavodoxin